MKLAYMKSGNVFLLVKILVVMISVTGMVVFAHPSYSDYRNKENAESPVIIKDTTNKNKPAKIESGALKKKFIDPVISLALVPLQAQIAHLVWTTTDTALTGTYYVERQVAPAVPSDPWDVIAIKAFDDTLEYNDTISFPYCTPTQFSYRIHFVATPSGLDFYSDIEVVILPGAILPPNVQNVVVSITPANYPVLSWTQVPGSGISGYEITRYNGFSWPVITKLPSDSASYTDKTARHVCDTSYRYIIVTLDKCGRRSAPDYNLFAQTLKLDFPPIDPCDRLAKLSWNPYLRMPDTLGGYNIFRSDNNGPFIGIADITDTLQTTYADNYPFVSGHDYTYYIQAYSKNGPGKSVSCKKSQRFTGSSEPIFVYLTSVSVEANSFLRTSYHYEPVNTVAKMVLLRSDDGGTNFLPIDSVSVASGFLPQNSFLDDNTADVNSQSYSYMLMAVDSCGNIRLESQISNSIFLECSTLGDQNSINWNEFQLWLNGVKDYELYRTVEGLPVSGELLTTVNPATLSYTDVLNGINPLNQVCYWVKAEEKPGNPYLTDAISLSNKCCIIREPRLFMPNAFHPGGTNYLFRPVQPTAYVDVQTFQMTIFNRWGQQIFETNDMFNGWDGMINGKDAPIDLYAYLITYTSMKGQDYTQRGTVSLIR
jgi:gliding motility-associated-like protein